MYQFKVKYLHFNEDKECDLFIPSQNVIFDEVSLDKIKLEGEVTKEHPAYDTLLQSFNGIILDEEHELYVIDREWELGVSFSAKDRLKNYKILSITKIA